MTKTSKPMVTKANPEEDCNDPNWLAFDDDRAVAKREAEQDAFDAEQLSFRLLFGEEPEFSVFDDENAL
jgi:hypothetical protein